MSAVLAPVPSSVGRSLAPSECRPRVGATCRWDIAPRPLRTRGERSRRSLRTVPSWEPRFVSRPLFFFGAAVKPMFTTISRCHRIFLALVVFAGLIRPAQAEHHEEFVPELNVFIKLSKHV